MILILFKYIVLYKMTFLLLLLVSMPLIGQSEHIVLGEGSLEQQTMGKDGIILFHYEYPDYWSPLIKNTTVNLTFFELDCNLYEDFCKEYSTTFPHLMYSVDNSLWQPITEENLNLFLFENFERRCAYNILKCKDHELETLHSFEQQPNEVIEQAIDKLRSKVVEFEATFADYYRQIEEEFNKKRMKIRQQLEKTEESIKVLQDILEAKT